MSRAVVVLTAVLPLLAASVGADPCGPPVLLGDLDQHIWGSFPSAFIEAGPKTFFTEALSEPDREPWVTDGTAAGTYRIADLAPGIAGSDPYYFGAVGSVALFWSSLNTSTLWRTDGSAAGTFEIAAGPFGFFGERGPTIAGVAYFMAQSSADGAELWRSDGTVSGTYPVADIAAGAADAFPRNFLVVSGLLFFTASDPVSGSELWRSDGTVAGTVRLTDVCAGTCNGALNARLAELGGIVYFAGSDGSSTGLFAYDLGTGAPRLLRAFNSAVTTWATWIQAIGGRLYLTADDGTSGAELWTSDGTTAGTVLVADINPGPASAFPRAPVEWGGRLFFRALEAASGDEPWTSDGTPAGTVRLADAFPGPMRVTPAPGPFVPTPSGVLFAACDGAPRKLWLTDGTPQGTRVFLPELGVGELQAGNDRAYFDGSNIDLTGGLWRTDGTVAGTALVSPLSDVNDPSSPHSFLSVGGSVVFAAHGDAPGAPGESGIWRTDGTPPGTTLVRGGPDGALIPFGGFVYAVGPGPLASGQLADHELWRSDGTAAGTGLFAALDPGPTSNRPYGFQALGSLALFFTASDGVTGQELWSTDGTLAGTGVVADLEPGSGGSRPFALAALGSRLVFVAQPAGTDQALYATDGTAAGTGLVVDPAPGPASAIFRESIVLDGRLYAAFYEGVFGTDGTPAGTSELIVPEVGWFDSHLIAGMNGKLFIAHAPLGPVDELWAYDVRRARAELIGTFQRTQAAYIGNGPLVNGTTLYFTASDGADRPALWRTDGSAAGTEMIAALWDGAWRAGPDSIAAVGPEVWFSASEPLTGRELWRTDGTTSGTVRVTDINPGPADGTVLDSAIAYLGGRIFFAGDDGRTALEPWSICVTAPRLALLRNTDARTPVTGGAGILPLTLLRDRYVDDFASGGEDPAPIVVDAAWPLVFYALDGEGELKLGKTPALGIRIEL